MYTYINRLSAGIACTSDMIEKQNAVAIARHGHSGGEFKERLWANGISMMEIPGRPHITITKAMFEQIKNAGWKVYG